MSSGPKTSSLRAMVMNRLRRKDLYSSAEYWDAKAVEYDEEAASWWPNRHLSRLHRSEIRRELDAALGSVDGKTILDLGCGTGKISRHLAGRGATVKAVDFAAEAIKVAEASTDDPAIEYGVGSVFDLEEVEVYDAVLTVGVLTVACKGRRELQDALHRIRRALKPGGTMVLFEAVHSGPLHRVLRLGRRGFLEAVEQAGLRVDLQRPVCAWPARVALGYVEWPAWITKPGYYAGDIVMRASGIRWLGDYFLVRGTR